MQNIEANNENTPKPVNISGVSSLLKVYLEARAEFIKKYGAKLPEWTL